MNEKNQSDSFYHLDPDLVLQATEAAGFHPTGEFTQLNSFENRVFDLRLENPDRNRVIGKFYRPGRWTKEAIQEEHLFLQELADEGLTVAVALPQEECLKGIPTLSQHEGLLVAFFERVSGRLPQELFPEDLTAIGRKLALLHNVGAQSEFRHRPILGLYPQTGWEVLDELLPRVLPEIRDRYQDVAENLIQRSLDVIDPESFQRIHGDAHRGNILHNGLSGAKSEYFFVDFDDSMMGPVSQDIWMLLSSEDSPDDLECLLGGYEQLREFPREQIAWIPLLRGLRILHYAAWINKRWSDPSFPRLFPQFGTYAYWAEETKALERALNFNASNDASS